MIDTKPVNTTFTKKVQTAYRALPELLESIIQLNSHNHPPRQHRPYSCHFTDTIAAAQRGTGGFPESPGNCGGRTCAQVAPTSPAAG